MTRNVVVILPDASPALEEFARAILEGAAGPREQSDGGVEVARPDGSVSAHSVAPLVFLGRFPAVEKSRTAAEAILANLRVPGRGIQKVARFDVIVAGDGTWDDSRPARGNVMDGGGSPSSSAPERFTIEARSTMSKPIAEELARARRWGARIAAGHRQKLAEATRDAKVSEANGTASRSVPWCGATE